MNKKTILLVEDKALSDKRTLLLPVVMLTSSNEERDVINGYQLGTNSYVQKPVDFTAFMDVVRQPGLYWLMLNQVVPPQNE